MIRSAANIRLATERAMLLHRAIARYPDEANVILFAFDAHGEQMYARGPYLTHLLDVRDVLADCPVSTPLETSIAAWLHDVLEDCHNDGDGPTTETQILDRFGRDVLKLVESVTTIGTHHRARTDYTIRRLREHPEAVSLKLADRIANVEACVRANNPKFEMYKRERAAFDALRLIGDDVARALWPRLDKAFDALTRGGA